MISGQEMERIYSYKPGARTERAFWEFWWTRPKLESSPEIYCS